MEENIKRFKKLFIVLFIFVCLFTLTACNKTEDLAKATYYSFTEEPNIIEF